MSTAFHVTHTFRISCHVHILPHSNLPAAGYTSSEHISILHLFGIKTVVFVNDISMNPIGSPINSSTPKTPPMPKQHQLPPSPARSGSTSEDSTNSVKSSSSRIGFHRNFPVNPSGCTAYRTWEHTRDDRNDQSFRRHVSHVSIPFNNCAEVTCSIDDDRIRIKHVPLKAVTKDITENSKTASPGSTSPINTLPINRAYRNNTR